MRHGGLQHVALEHLVPDRRAMSIGRRRRRWPTCTIRWASFWTLAVLGKLFGFADWMLRIAPLVYVTATTALLWRLGRALWGEIAGALTAVAFVALPITLGYANYHDLEQPVIFGCVLATWGYVRLLQSWRLRHALAGARGLRVRAGPRLAGVHVGRDVPARGCSCTGTSFPTTAACADRRARVRPLLGAAGAGRRRQPRRRDRRALEERSAERRARLVHQPLARLGRRRLRSCSPPGTTAST